MVQHKLALLPDASFNIGCIWRASGYAEA